MKRLISFRIKVELRLMQLLNEILEMVKKEAKTPAATPAEIAWGVVESRRIRLITYIRDRLKPVLGQRISRNRSTKS